MLDRINFPLLQQKFPENSGFILLVFKHASSMCLGKLHSSNGKLSSLFIDIKTTDRISKDAFLNTRGEPVAVGGGPVWVYCQKILNTNEIHDSNKEQAFHFQTSRSVCPRKAVKNPHTVGQAPGSPGGGGPSRHQWEMKKHHRFCSTRDYSASLRGY